MNAIERPKRGRAHLKVPLGYKIAHPLDHPDGSPVRLRQSAWNRSTCRRCVGRGGAGWDRRRSRWTVNTRGSVFHQEKCSRSRKLVVFCPFSRVYFSTRTPAERPSEINFPEKVHRSPEKQQTYPAWRHTGCVFVCVNGLWGGWIVHMFWRGTKDFGEGVKLGAAPWK